MSAEYEDPDAAAATLRARASTVFAAFYTRRENGESVRLDDVCAEHPELATELRSIQADWLRVEPVV